MADECAWPKSQSVRSARSTACVHFQRKRNKLARNPAKVLIVGASGNLGFHLTQHLLAGPHRQRWLTHKRAGNLDDAVDVLTNRLKRNGTGEISLNNFDVSGALFQPGPEAFLPRTNTVSLSELRIS